MGMYTEICTNVPLVEDLPDNILAVLKYMTEGGDVEPALPEHDFFKCPRWRMVLTCSSFYFVPFAHTKLKYDDIAKQYFLCARADLKNYDREIDKFFAWLDPYIDEPEGRFVGYSRYEEDDTPKLYFKLSDSKDQP